MNFFHLLATDELRGEFLTEFAGLENRAHDLARIANCVLACQEISKLTVDIGSLPQDWVLGRHLENFEHHIERMDAVVISGERARAADFGADGGFIFVIEAIFEGEAERAGLAD